MEDISNWQSKFIPSPYSDRLLAKIKNLNKATTKQVDICEIEKAIYYAKKYHGQQMRQSGEPYYSHPLEVAYMVSNYLFRTEIIVTSILHDTIEDTDLTFDMIKLIFNETIANQVRDLTRIKEDGKKISASDTVEHLWLQKKYDLLLVKQFDRLHNMQTLGAKSPEKMKKIIAETLQTFIVLATYLEIPIIRQELIQLCYEHLGISELFAANSHPGFSLDSSQPLCPTFQNEIDQIKSLFLPEA